MANWETFHRFPVVELTTEYNPCGSFKGIFSVLNGGTAFNLDRDRKLTRNDSKPENLTIVHVWSVCSWTAGGASVVVMRIVSPVLEDFALATWPGMTG